MSAQIHSYSDLQQQIHEDLRIQHPDWVKPNGDCPTCDSYEVRLAELLGLGQPSTAVRHGFHCFGAAVIRLFFLQGAPRTQRCSTGKRVEGRCLGPFSRNLGGKAGLGGAAKMKPEDSPTFKASY